MHTISLNQPYRLSVFDQQTGLGVPALLAHSLGVIMLRAFPNGMGSTDTRLWARIEDKLLAAAEAAAEAAGANGCPVELEDTELDFLDRTLSKCENHPPQNARAGALWMDLIAAAKRKE